MFISDNHVDDIKNALSIKIGLFYCQKSKVDIARHKTSVLKIHTTE